MVATGSHGEEADPLPPLATPRLGGLEELCVMGAGSSPSAEVVARQVPEPKAHQKQLLAALKLKLPATVPAAEVIVGTRKKIKQVRKTLEA